MENQENSEFGEHIPLNEKQLETERNERKEIFGMEINEDGHLINSLSSDEMLKEKLDAKQVELLSAKDEEKEAIEKEISDLEVKLGLKKSN